MGRHRKGDPGTVKTNCIYCGKEFETYVSKLDINKGKHCSKRCYYDHKKLLVGELNPKWNQTEIRCPICDKIFYVKQSRLRRSKVICCSIECSSKYKSLHNIGPNASNWRGGECIEVSCAWCGSKLLRTKVRAKSSELHFCDTKCVHKYQSISFRLDGNPSWKGGKSFELYCHKFNKLLKKQVRIDFNSKCYLCHRLEEENGRKLDIHHVDYDKSQGCSGKKWCLIPLCVSCHRKTNHNRWYWFNLLKDYWIYDYIDFMNWYIN